MRHATDGRAGRPARRRNGRPDMRRTATTERRGAFPLVELINVIGNNGLVAGLLLQAVMKARQTGERTEVKHDIAQVEAAMKNFQATYDMKYFPSGFILTSDYAQPPGNPQIAAALQESAQYYSKVWPKAFIPGQPGKTPLPPNLPSAARSEERRVGKECRTRRARQRD